MKNSYIVILNEVKNLEGHSRCIQILHYVTNDEIVGADLCVCPYSEIGPFHRENLVNSSNSSQRVNSFGNFKQFIGI